jgi:hypothetical protein
MKVNSAHVTVHDKQQAHMVVTVEHIERLVNTARAIATYQDREVVCEFDGCENRRGACLTPRHPGCASCPIP